MTSSMLLTEIYFFPNDYLLFTNRVLITSITNLVFTNLLSFDSPTPDSIIHNILSICQKTHPSLKFLDPQFSSALSQQGWKQSYTKFLLYENSSRYVQMTQRKPFIHNPIIIIPFFIRDSRWLAVVCWEIHGHIYFL
jgi:hypothetical protein